MGNLTPTHLACRPYSDPLEIAEAETIDEICRLRARVWEATGQAAATAFPDGGWRDPYDSDCPHWIIRDHRGRLVAAARVTVHDRLEEVPEAEEYLRYGLRLPGPIAAPARVVVLAEAQGGGLARRLLDAQDAFARRAGARHAVRQASPAMVRLLVRRAWRILGPATPDPRFTGFRFEVAVLDLSDASTTPDCPT
ncbi:MAG: GNAT family N-acetyltransferase [Planctomycetes bacterium]|nr:GNAT family N-acetyltransferase [Planctomycetota bacterium]